MSPQTHYKGIHLQESVTDMSLYIARAQVSLNLEQMGLTHLLHWHPHPYSCHLHSLDHSWGAPKHIPKFQALGSQAHVMAKRQMPPGPARTSTPYCLICSSSILVNVQGSVAVASQRFNWSGTHLQTLNKAGTNVHFWHWPSWVPRVATEKRNKGFSVLTWRQASLRSSLPSSACSPCSVTGLIADSNCLPSRHPHARLQQVMNHLARKCSIFRILKNLPKGVKFLQGDGNWSSPAGMW